MDTPDWKGMIEVAVASRSAPVNAQTYGNKAWGTASRPVLLRCSDDNDYVVKGKQIGRPLITEQIMGALGSLIGAPVPKMLLVAVSADLISAQAEMAHMHEGVAHGCLYVKNCEGPRWIGHQDNPQNKLRHARLAVLYGLAQVNDRQLLYELSKPPLVWSVDHGNFGLLAGGSAAPYVDIVREAQIGPEDLVTVKADLQSVRTTSIAQVVAMPHESWGITLDERIAIAQDIEKKRIEMIASIP